MLDLATGGELVCDRVLTHGSGVIIGFVGVQRLGLPRGAAWKAMAAYVPLWALTRAVTPPWANVNLAFSVYQGWQTWFTSYPPYFVMLLGFGLVTFIAAEQMLSLMGRTQADGVMRYFLVDKVTALVAGERASGIKCVTLSDEILHDHFPGLSRCCPARSSSRRRRSSRAFCWR